MPTGRRRTFFHEATDFLNAFNQGRQQATENDLRQKLIQQRLAEGQLQQVKAMQGLQEYQAGQELAAKMEQGVSTPGADPNIEREGGAVPPQGLPQATQRPYNAQELQQLLLPYAVRGHPTAINALKLLQAQQQQQQKQTQQQQLMDLMLGKTGGAQGQATLQEGQSPLQQGQPQFFPSLGPTGLSIKPHFPPPVRQPGPPASPELFAQQQELARLRSSLAEQNKPRRLAPKGTYIDKEGQIQEVTYEDEAQGLKRLDHGSMREKIFGSSNIVYNHIDQVLNHLEGMAKGDHNRFVQFMNNSISNFRNDPDAIALFHFLGPANMVATSNVYASQSAGMRGSARLAFLMRSMGLEKGDSLGTALKAKLTPLAQLNLANIKDGNLPTGKFQQQLARIQALIQEGDKSSGSVTLGGKAYRRQ